MTEQHLEELYRGFHNDDTFARESLTVLGKDGQLRTIEFDPAEGRALSYPEADHR